MNRSSPYVPKQQPLGGPSAVDRRVVRTRHSLTMALVELVLEKRYDAITIQDLLERADVGRSTFYAHYRGKDDLLLRSFEQMLGRLDAAMGEDGNRLAPVRELFRHVGGEAKVFHRALARARRIDRLYQVGVDQFADTIERRLAARSPGSHAVPAAVRARARALSGALFALLRWWLDEDLPYDAERMDALFHAFAGRSGGVTSAGGG